MKSLERYYNRMTKKELVEELLYLAEVLKEEEEWIVKNVIVKWITVIQRFHFGLAMIVGGKKNANSNNNDEWQSVWHLPNAWQRYAVKTNVRSAFRMVS